MGLCLVSAITEESKENPIAFLESLKEALQKFNNLDLRLLQGTGDFKGQSSVPVCIRCQDKVTIAPVAGPCCLFRWSRQPPVLFITENRTESPRPRRGREGKRQSMPRCWPPSREALWQTSSP